MNEIVIKTHQLARSYQTYRKEPGLFAAIKGLVCAFFLANRFWNWSVIRYMTIG